MQLLNESELRLANLIGLRADDCSEEIIKLLKYALASNKYYSQAASCCKKVLRCN